MNKAATPDMSMDMSHLPKCGNSAYVCAYSRLAELLSPWRQPKLESEAVNPLPSPVPQAEVTSQPAERQISPQLTAALSKPRPELTPRQGGGRHSEETVSGLCGDVQTDPRVSQHPVRGKVETLEIHSLGRFVPSSRTSVRWEAGVGGSWSNGPVEGQINRLKA